jgi:hypothetical protein
VFFDDFPLLPFLAPLLLVVVGKIKEVVGGEISSSQATIILADPTFELIPKAIQKHETFDGEYSPSKLVKLSGHPVGCGIMPTININKKKIYFDLTSGEHTFVTRKYRSF